jgi:hypothetical protein
LVSVHMNGSRALRQTTQACFMGSGRKNKDLAPALFGELKKLPTGKPDDSDGELDARQPYQYASAVLLSSGAGREHELAERFEVGIVNYIGPP